MSTFTEILAALMAHPPDRNAPVPVSNRPATLYGATLPFHVLSWIAVIFRLYTRFRVVREPGWDDYIIILTAIFNLASMVSLLGAIQFGLGKHLLYLGPENITIVMKFLYFQTACYYTCTCLVKLSLLCQYLRLFRSGALRKLCIALLILVGLWSCVWLMQGWFPCFPVSGYWHRLQTPPPKCWGAGFSSAQGALAAFIGFASTNMFFDIAIFTIPMAVYFKPTLSKRQVFALLGLFLLGSVVVCMSVLRLWTVIRQKSTGYINAVDFTWWYPLTLIISSLEIDFAIICASIPIFWPVIVASLPQIFVTQEVRVTHHNRLSKGNSMAYEMGRPTSLKSTASQEGLTRDHELSKTDYGDPFVVEQVLGKVPQNTEVMVGKKPKKRWIR